MAERILVAPGVEQFGVISVAPLSGLLATVPFSTPDRGFEDRQRPNAKLRAISPGYLPRVGTQLIEARPFSESDRSDTPAVALVSAALAERFLSGRAVGQRLLIKVHSAWVSSVRDNRFWMVRTASDPAAVHTTFAASLRAVDPDAAISSTGAMRQFLDASLGPRRFNLGLFGGFALTAGFLWSSVSMDLSRTPSANGNK